MSLAGAVLELVGSFVLHVVWEIGCYGVGKGLIVVASLGRWSARCDDQAPTGYAPSGPRLVPSDIARLVGAIALLLAIVGGVLLARELRG